jgi:hypothetical protein
MIVKVDCVKGSIHDFKLFKKSKLKFSKQIIILADLGYLGIKQLFENAKIPFKSSKKNPLTQEEKEFNKDLSRKRIIVENKIRECKIFRIVKDVYRGKHKNYGLMWNLVAGLVNFKASTKHLDYAS